MTWSKWPYAAEFVIPDRGLVVGDRRERLTTFLAAREHHPGAGGLAVARYHFRQEADADAYVAAFTDLDARRVAPPVRHRRRSPYDFS